MTGNDINCSKIRLVNIDNHDNYLTYFLLFVLTFKITQILLNSII